MTTHLANTQTMILESNNGYSSTLDLSSIESIVFEGNNLVVHKISCGDNYFNAPYSKTVTFGTGTTAADYTEDTSNSISIFPNPVSNSLVINKLSDTQADVRIINAKGAVVKSTIMYSQQSSIDISDLTNGLYFIQIDKQSTKFIKQ